MKIGGKIKELRKKANMTLEELSKKSKVALATLSRIENGKMTGTLESHMSIAKALNVSITELYSHIAIEEKRAQILRDSESGDTFIHGTGESTLKFLTRNVMSKKMLPILITIKRSGGTHREETQKMTEKFIYVLQGTLEAYIGKEAFVLHKYDSLYFDASLPHFFKNAGKDIAQAICLVCPPAL